MEGKGRDAREMRGKDRGREKEGEVGRDEK